MSRPDGTDDGPRDEGAGGVGGVANAADGDHFDVAATGRTLLGGRAVALLIRSGAIG